VSPRRRLWLAGGLLGAGSLARQIAAPIARRLALPVLRRLAARFARTGAAPLAWLPPTAGVRAADSTGPAPGRPFAAVVPGRRLTFPADHGAHPDFRTEWWYITGWADVDGVETGIQITFFRSGTGHSDANPSRFAPSQLLLAHAALARVSDGRLRHDQRSARLGFADTRMSGSDTALSLRGWHLTRQADDRYIARIAARDFELDLSFQARAAPMPQGELGFSRKGPGTAQASYYYSRPQLEVGGALVLGGRRLPVRSGRAWLDHEWSSEVLDAQAVGWDWVGLNLDDGSSLMAFRIRHRDATTLWSHARWLPAVAPALSPQFEVVRRWRSARSGGVYPVSMRIGVGGRLLELQPLFDDQELDARASTGGFYWEGAVRVSEQGRTVGRGYLELTGYAAPLRL
jgi:predicted secreted hydrolase